MFLDLGGFDPSLYRRPAIEDIELGYRLSRSGHRVVLARDVLATHLKRWTLGTVLKTDVFHRGVPWMLLMLRSRTAETDLNVSRSQRMSVMAVGLGWAALPLAIKFPVAALVPAAGLAAIAWMNRAFYGFLARRAGWRFAVAAFPLHYLYFCCCGVSVVIASALRALPRTRRDHSRPASLRAEAATSSAPHIRTIAPVKAREQAPRSDRP